LVAAGWGGMTWVYCAEMFPQKHRTKAGRSLDVGGLGFVAETGKVPEDTVRDKIFVCICIDIYIYIYIRIILTNYMSVEIGDVFESFEKNSLPLFGKYSSDAEFASEKPPRFK